MKMLPYILIAAVVLFAIVFFGRIDRSVSDSDADYPIYVAFAPNLDDYMGPIGDNHSISWDVPFEGNSHSVTLWRSEHSDNEVILHFQLSGPSDTIEAEQNVKIDPSIENTLTIFDSLVVSTRPKIWTAARTLSSSTGSGQPVPL